MRRSLRWIAWGVAGLSALVLLCLLVLLLATITPAGRAAIERNLNCLSAGQLVISGLDADFPEQLSLQSLALHDTAGVWLTADQVLLNWQPARLLAGEVAISVLQAQRISLQRLPAPAAATQTSSSPSLPLALKLAALRIQQLQLPAALAGAVTDYSLAGRINLGSDYDGDLELALQQQAGQGEYHLQARLNQAEAQAHLVLQELGPGLLATLTGLQNQAAIDLQADLSGPLAALHCHLVLEMAALHGVLDGEINLPANSADLQLSANGTALQWGADFAWQAVALDMQLHGQWPALAVNASLAVDKLQMDNVELGRLALNLQGSAGQLVLDAELAGLKLNQAPADVLRAAPLRLQASLDLTKADYPTQFALQHPLLTGSGQAGMADGGVQADVALVAPELQAFAAELGIAIAGRADLQLNYAAQAADQQLDISGLLSVSGDGDTAKLLGESAKFGLAAHRHDQEISLSALHLDGKNLQIAATGNLTAELADADWQLTFNDVSALLPAAAGRFSAQGQLTGKPDDLNLSADLKAELQGDDFAGAPLAARLRLAHLPDAAAGELTLNGDLWRAPIAVQLAVSSPARQAVRLGIEKADWKSVHAQGEFNYILGQPLPVGAIDLAVKRLADLPFLLKQSPTGSFKARLETAQSGAGSQARLNLDAANIGMSGVAATAAKLELNIADPTGLPRYAGRLDLKDFQTAGLGGSGQINLNGQWQALNLRLAAGLTAPFVQPVQLTAAAQLDGLKQVLRFNSLQAHWSQQSLALLQPAQLNFKTGLAVDKLRLGWRQAELEIAGQISPDLALTAKLHDAPAELISVFAPELALTGMLRADASLQGKLDQPSGVAHLSAEHLHMPGSVGAALPPASLSADLVLHGDSAALTAKLDAGAKTHLQLAGQLPLNNTGLLAVQGQAAVDLQQLDAVLNAEGRRARGQLQLDMQLAGSWPEPLFSAKAELRQGEWQDFSAGVAVSDIGASLTAADGELRIISLQAKAGPGTLSAAGSIDLFKAGMPLNISLHASHAQPLSSDILTANLDADVLLGGFGAAEMTATGRIHINRADIRIPERLPSGIAVLQFSNSQTPAVPAAPPSHINLDLSLDAPSEIFVRGRGVDAELGGELRILGSADQPRPQGEFKLRNGQFTLAGQKLTINQGAIAFNNNSLTNPSLNFIANTTRNNIAAVLSVTGSVKNPIILLSSTPKLPQDEVLANLLFGKGSASLSTLELVQIASTLASLTGVTAGMGDPLENVRRRLGLDRLSVGGATPSLEAGRYIAPGVYLGAKQGISGSAPQPMIQIDISKNLKLEGGVGSGGAASSTSGSAVTNSVGVIYQIEY